MDEEIKCDSCGADKGGEDCCKKEVNTEGEHVCKEGEVCDHGGEEVAQ